MFKQVSFDISNTHIEGFEIIPKVSKRKNYLWFQVSKKWQVFGTTSTQLSIIKKSSNGILLNMKVVDLSLPFPKSPRS
jgi:hypothetical protein